MVILSEDAAILGAAVKHELGEAARGRVRRRAARAELRRTFAARRANGLIDRRAARLARARRIGRSYGRFGARTAGTGSMIPSGFGRPMP
jgi:hypothetical protein